LNHLEPGDNLSPSNKNTQSNFLSVTLRKNSTQKRQKYHFNKQDIYKAFDVTGRNEKDFEPAKNFFIPIEERDNAASLKNV
jgi:hypothetical protein